MIIVRFDFLTIGFKTGGRRYGWEERIFIDEGILDLRVILWVGVNDIFVEDFVEAGFCVDESEARCLTWKSIAMTSGLDLD